MRWRYGIEILRRDSDGRLHYCERCYLDDDELKELKEELKKKSFKRIILDQAKKSSPEPGRYLFYFFKEKRKKGRIKKKKVLERAEVEL